MNLFITTNHSGKMEGMASISTSPLTNKFCQAHRNVENSICQHCFSVRQLNRYKNQHIAYSKNMEVLSSGLLADEDIPFLNFAYFRIEAFGDIENETQAMNYLQLVKKNPQTRFAWFTKNPLILASALKKMGYTKATGKPENLNIVLSSLYMNQPTESKFWFVDKYFTVYDKETAKTQNINCGAKKCLSCRLCYEKNDTSIINEEVK